MNLRLAIVVLIAATWFILGFAIGRASASRSGPVIPAPTNTASPAASFGTVGSSDLGPTEAPIGTTVASEPSPTVLAATPRASTLGRYPSASVSGIASWYCCTRGWGNGLFAAAGPRLRAWLGPGWRGDSVAVCAAICIRVRLIDYCGCPGGRVIDLETAAFARLAPLSRGVIAVVIHA